MVILEPAMPEAGEIDEIVGATVNVPALISPLGVKTNSVPSAAVGGTVVVTDVPSFENVNDAREPAKFTSDAKRFVPVKMIEAPTRPLVALMWLNVGGSI
jgi:hypothetical protein